MSYRKRHIKSKIHRIKPKISIFKRLWFWVVLLFLVIVSVVLYFFLFYPGIQIKDIIISGNQKVASEDIKNLIFNDINNKILSIGSWDVNSKSIFLINSDKIDREILNKFPIIESVKIDKKFMQTLKVRVNEKVPAVVFCQSPDETKCYFMDGNGIVFEPLDIVPENLAVVRQAVNDVEVFTGEKVVQQNIMDYVLKIEKDLKDNFQISLKDALITSPLRLNINTSENWQIYFDLSSDSDVNLQITKLNLLLYDGISADSMKNLRYIDLRPKDRAIICDNKICGG